ncbi:hypothetical protein [Streptomyces flavofungini]|uniref:hypothetical protein n=1 Tax=Streptomyces flavofungini TaxID=68200 RepID=UPI0025B0CDBE|nr:hypothetical protein [Streptomyces flavofungini]WJV51738.1 hypothetical protein QUY26_39610 [Streptomyces flavofungini]
MATTADDGEDRLNADIQEFSIHDNKGGWARALLIARRVEPGEGDGVRTEYQSRRFGRTAFRRVSAREFARRSKSSHKRIMAILQAWERAAADGVVPPAEELSPDTAVELPDADAVPFFGQNGYYRSWEASNLKRERSEAILAEAERAGVKPGSTAYIAGHPTALTTAILADETARSAAQRGIDEFNRRQDLGDSEIRSAAGQPAREPDRKFDLAPTPDTPPESDAEAEEVEPASESDDLSQIQRAVRATSQQTEPDVALQVFTEMTDVRLGTLRALSLLQRNQVQFTGERSRAIAELCGAAQAALEFIRDLASGPYTALNDDALQAFLAESERKLG